MKPTWEKMKSTHKFQGEVYNCIFFSFKLELSMIGVLFWEELFSKFLYVLHYNFELIFSEKVNVLLYQNFMSFYANKKGHHKVIGILLY